MALPLTQALTNAIISTPNPNPNTSPLTLTLLTEWSHTWVTLIGSSSIHMKQPFVAYLMEIRSKHNGNTNATVDGNTTADGSTSANTNTSHNTLSTKVYCIVCVYIPISVIILANGI